MLCAGSAGETADYRSNFYANWGQRQPGAGAVDFSGGDERGGRDFASRDAGEFGLLDEVGRGTSTFDGLSIAWAVVEHLQKHTGARTLFATHYHELTELADLLTAVKNVHVSVKEMPNEIVFLRRVEPGSADKSYGIEVARLAGLPRSVIERAREVLRKHEQSEHELSETLSPGAAGANGNRNGHQEVLFTALDREVIEKLRGADLDQLKPLDALNLLAELKKQIS